jgi:hypothetical protein
VAVVATAYVTTTSVVAVRATRPGPSTTNIVLRGYLVVPVITERLAIYMIRKVEERVITI